MKQQLGNNPQLITTVMNMETGASSHVSPSSAGASDESSPGPKARKRRKQVRVACTRCIRFKRRCDSGRPSCASCARANITCQYATDDPEESRSQAMRRQYNDLVAQHQATHDALHWLRSQSAETVLMSFKRLETASDPVGELCSVVALERSRNLPRKPPMQTILTATSNFVRSDLTFELFSRCPAAYPWSSEAASPSASNGRLSLHALPNMHQPESIHSRVACPNVPAWRSSMHPGLQPKEAGVFDPRLRDLKIHFWTTVPISDELAAKLITSYLQVEQPVYGFFDADLFLRDLIAREVRYCSPLLVNSLLFWACCTFGPIYPGASVLAKAFLEAAQVLLAAEQNNSIALNVASLMILSISTVCFGRDALGKKYMIAGIQMAEELSLVGEQRKAVGEFCNLSRDGQSMLSFVAWGAFNWSTVYLLHFHDVFSGTYTKRPPLLPRPGDEALVDGINVQNHHSLPPSPYKGTTFAHFCRFWCIAHEIASVLYSSPEPVHQHVPLAFAESKFHSLLEWADSLPREAIRSDGMSHNVAEMHICYHATIMDLFRPFMAQKELLQTFSTDPRRPEAIFMFSLEHLRALVHYYRTSFAGSAEFHTISWIHGPLYVAPATLHHCQMREGWKAEFLFCIESCSGLFQSHYVLETFMMGLLGMAVDEGALMMAQAKACLASLQAMRESSNSGELLETAVIVDQDLAMKSRAAAIGDILRQKFDQLVFIDDVIELGE